MMGANWRPDPIETTTEEFAWWPVRSSFSKRRIWLKKYIKKEIYQDSELSHPLRSNTYTLIYTLNEHLLYLMRRNEY